MVVVAGYVAVIVGSGGIGVASVVVVAVGASIWVVRITGARRATTKTTNTQQQR